MSRSDAERTVGEWERIYRVSAAESVAVAPKTEAPVIAEGPRYTAAAKAAMWAFIALVLGAAVAAAGGAAGSALQRAPRFLFAGRA
jgi:hypothetical protein